MRSNRALGRDQNCWIEPRNGGKGDTLEGATREEERRSPRSSLPLLMTDSPSLYLHLTRLVKKRAPHQKWCRNLQRKWTSFPVLEDGWLPIFVQLNFLMLFFFSGNATHTAAQNYTFNVKSWSTKTDKVIAVILLSIYRMIHYLFFFDENDTLPTTTRLICLIKTRYVKHRIWFLVDSSH